MEFRLYRAFVHFLTRHCCVYIQPTMLQWIEIATKLFNTDSRCCEWFMNTMADDDWWPQQILIKCPNHTVRQVGHSLTLLVRSFVSSGAAVDCWQSFDDVPSATASAEA